MFDLPILASLVSWCLFLFVVATGVMGLWAFYVWWKKDKNTRERFAFYGFAGLMGLIAIFFMIIKIDSPIVADIIASILSPLGITVSLPASPISPLESILAFSLILVMIGAYWNIFINWNGQKSIAQHEQEQNREHASIIRDIHLLLNKSTESKQKLIPYCPLQEQYEARLSKPEQLVWHERAKQLWLLKNRSYLLDDIYDPAHQCWLGSEKNTGDLILLTCPHTIPDKKILLDWIDYAKKVSETKQYPSYKIIVALKGNDNITNHLSDQITYTCENELLSQLIDFTDYFNDIRYRVEKVKLPESDLVLKDTYSPSYYKESKQKETANQTVEDYIQEWLKKHTEKQLAILGEYGQGKSTVSLLLSYHLIQQYNMGKSDRIPILIELRGKTLRTLTPEELLAGWAYQYGVDVKALLHWHMAGKLLLIFEGFDEIDLSGDTEARINHFNTIWKFNYENAKLIITGRPNFFLDSSELTRALGKEDETNTLYLQPFNIQQIADSLRSTNPQVKKEIIDFSEKDAGFLEVASRPSLLYLISILWTQEQLYKYKELNSAIVIDLFIKQTLKRQQDKHDDRPFMILNSAERYYFMMGVAVYMATKELPNQIDKGELQESIKKLIDAIPENISRSISSMSGESSLPLRSPERFDWNNRKNEIIEKIGTDVRACGLLITDLSKDGAFKFAHKSYMELLQAKFVEQLFSSQNTMSSSIKNTFNISIERVLSQPEAMQFFVELLKDRISKDQMQKNVHEAVWDIFFDKGKNQIFQLEKNIIKAYSLLAIHGNKLRGKITKIFLFLIFINALLLHGSSNEILFCVLISIVELIPVLMITVIIKNELAIKNKDNNREIKNFAGGFLMLSSLTSLASSGVGYILKEFKINYESSINLLNNSKDIGLGLFHFYSMFFILILLMIVFLTSKRTITISYLWFVVCKMLKVTDSDVEKHIGSNMFMIYEKHYLKQHE